MEVNVLKNKQLIQSTNPDWKSYSENALDPDTPIGSIDRMIFDQTSKAPTVLQVLRHILWVNKIRIINNLFYFYNCEKGCFFRIDENNERICINQFFSPRIQQLISTSCAKEAISRLKSIPHIQMDLDELDSDSNLINVANGVLNIMEGKVLPKSHKYKFSYCLNIDYYRINAKWELCPTFQSFCKTSLRGDNKKIELLLQILGYLWSKKWGAKVAFFFVGEANSGKSVMLELIKYVWHYENVSTIPLHKLGDRFNIASLSNKALNICAEMKSTAIKNIDIFKAITSGDTLCGEYKGKDIFSFTCRTKLLFSGNMMPSIAEAEASKAFLNRICMLSFTKEIPKEQQNPNLFEQLKEERNVIFSLSIESLQKLVDNNFDFIMPQETVAYLHDYAAQQNHIDDFIENCCQKEANVKIPSAAIYERYLDYCSENFIKPYPLCQFSEYFRRIAKVDPIHARFDGDLRRGFSGITLK